MDDAGSAPAKGSLPARGSPVRFGEFTLDLDGCSLSSTDSGDIPLTRSEFALLREFIHHPGRVLSRNYLLDALAGKRPDPFDRSIDMLVGRLRRKIEPDAKPPRLIVTVPGEGYKFAAPIRVEAPKLSSESATLRPAASLPNKHEPPRLSMVVLPFANLSGDPSHEHFVDGATENLTTDLSRIRRAVVMGRNTAFTYKGKAVDLKQIGRELNVRYVIEGSVQCGGNRMRVNVQLIDAETGNHLWAERFDKPLTDLFDMQDEIVARLANALNAQLAAAEARRAEQASSPNSMDLYFQGMAWLNKGHAPQNVAQAHRCFDRALIADPGNVDALVGSARADAVDGINLFVTDPAAALVAAEAKLIKALSLVPGHPHGHMWSGLSTYGPSAPPKALPNVNARSSLIEILRRPMPISASVRFSLAAPKKLRRTLRRVYVSVRAIWRLTSGWAGRASGTSTSVVGSRRSRGIVGRSRRTEISLNIFCTGFCSRAAWQPR